MLFFNLSVPLALLASLALSAPIDDSATSIARSLEKRDFLVDNTTGTITSNPTLADIVARKVEIGCFVPSKGYTLYFVKAYDCARFDGIKVYPAESAST